jgi:hypothetical protein
MEQPVAVLLPRIILGNVHPAAEPDFTVDDDDLAMIAPKERCGKPPRAKRTERHAFNAGTSQRAQVTFVQPG